ncbi:hypothetical protein CEXT_616271 [Caerostris extrusa]|uniref:Uncharacterized protein n=1 Tax=Caerostris extrusa TaxID=172846 RepID=A0AAV4NUJ1_CAEEX|nr:hypothetical protein CEXT_616271 [Caerostris extrusa]
MPRLSNTSSFKEIPNVLDEDLKCSIGLASQDGGPRNYHERENNYFSISWGSENGCHSKSLPSAGSDEDASFVRFGSTTNSLPFESEYYFTASVPSDFLSNLQ